MGNAANLVSNYSEEVCEELTRGWVEYIQSEAEAKAVSSKKRVQVRSMTGAS